jgi:hypothetical protein
MRYVTDFISAVKARQAEVAQSLAVGHASNFDAYQRLVGEHAGLERSLEILNNLLKEEEDDDR